MIEETGSLRSASISMGLAYTKALRMINKAEKELGFSLTNVAPVADPVVEVL